MKKLLILLISAASIISCSDVEGVTYNDSSTYVGFEETTYNLPVVVNSSSTVDVNFVASSLSSAARTYNLSVVTAESNADPLTYSVPATLTIPANQYVGTVTITGTDNNLLDFVIKKLVIKVSGLNSVESTDTEKITVNLFEVCPLVIADFVGGFNATTFWLGSSSHEVIEGSVANTLEIVDFWEDNATAPNFVISYDADNKVTFADQDTGYFHPTYGANIRARMSTVVTNVSKIDPCSNKIILWVNYYIPGVGSFGDKQEVFTKQ